MKFFGKFVIYLLVSIGAVITLMPFGWMVSTSFKLPSEVNKWPPQWGSENFLSKREIKVRVGAETIGVSWEGIGIREALSMISAPEVEENALYMVVDDDPFYRGEVHILVTSDGDYAYDVPLESVTDLIERYRDFFDGGNFKNADDFFDSVFIEYAKLFDRLSFINSVTGTLSNAARSLTVVERFASRRIKDGRERERFSEYLSDVRKALENASSRISTFRKGKTKLLDDGEIDSIEGELEKLLASIEPPEFTDPGARNLTAFLRRKVLEPISYIRDELEFYFEVKSRFKAVQRDSLGKKEIIAKFRPERDRVTLLENRMESDPVLKPYMVDLRALLSKGHRDLPERFLKLLDGKMARRLVELGMGEDRALSTVPEIRQIVSTLLSISGEENVDPEELAKNSESFEEFYEKLVEALGERASLKVVGGKVRKISRDLQGDLLPLIVEGMEEIKAVARLRKIYDNALSELELVAAPDVVEAVRVKEGKSIEIVLKNAAPVYLKDEKYRVAVFFSFKEVLANVFQNYVDAWHAAPFGRYYLNTVFVATATTVLEVILASMAAFAFSILKFPGRDFIFGLFLMTMMVPGEVLLVPNFITVTKFGWIDTYYALIVPWIVSVFAIFLIRQHFLTLPMELYDAAKIDGCSNWRYLWTIAVPLSKPVIITGALLKFVGSWNAFLWVLIVTNSEKYRTLPVGLHTFSSEAGTVYNQLMAAATFSVLPVIVLFLFMQKYFIRGIARTGLK